LLWALIGFGPDHWTAVRTIQYSDVKF